ncbi:DUF1415 domain-containing protein [Alteromonas gilva]|uniref:DUF1415 domain-containing protein n=1 Tax=Alteromonas gilva TaxID=2987522 RepID=A0ABT5L8F0_9ALTE|nr:DUF1415 domain-containing protein [Alteromonas gilva]MDC8832716.1 DUF1415 domain-containing protein [Alteromonas gilva]
MSSDTLSVACQQVERWLDSMVIGHNFCPFARHVRERNSIRYVDLSFHDMADVLHALQAEFHYLDQHSDTSTTLIVLSAGWASFDDYLLLMDMAQQSLEHWQYEGIYQLASFHPDYLFAGESADAPSHYTNRAPHPVMHIIREADIEQALAYYDQPESIPQNNIATTERLGCAHLKKQLNAFKTGTGN